MSPMMPNTYVSGSGSADSRRLSTPEWWFDEIVKKNLADFECNPTSFRLAFNAAVTAYHFQERVLHYHIQRDSLDKLKCDLPPVTTRTVSLNDLKVLERTFQRCLEIECDALRLLGNVANAVKHHVRTHTKNENSFKNATATEAARLENGGLWIYDAEGNCHGRTLDLLKTTVQFWERWLANHPSN